MANYATESTVNLRHNASYRAYMGWAGAAADSWNFICQSIITPQNGSFKYNNRGAGWDNVIYFKLLNQSSESLIESKVGDFSPTFGAGTISIRLRSSSDVVHVSLQGFYSYKENPNDWFWHKITLYDNAEIKSGENKTLSVACTDGHSPITNAKIDVTVGQLIVNNTKNVIVDFYRNI